MMNLYLAAPQKSSGKTTLAIGICRALRERGRIVQPFKKGPDYIDPLWLTQAAGRTCYNLDFHTMAASEIVQAVRTELKSADLGIIEGNMGLFDSIDLAGTQSNAELAKLLNSPVILIINCEGLVHGIAPLILGYLAFDLNLKITGVILNKIGGARHAAKLTQAVEHYTDLPIVGIVPRDAEIKITERHLGLIPSNEIYEAETWITKISQRVCAEIDLERLLNLAEDTSLPNLTNCEDNLFFSYSNKSIEVKSKVRIGIARDAAFGFYYPDDLKNFIQHGAELIYFSPIKDLLLPEVDALLLGGGFPEFWMTELEANFSLRQAIAAFIAQNKPVYAECGGLLYLCEELRWQNKQCKMVGALAASAEMQSSAQGRGYVHLRETAAFPWPRLTDASSAATITAHEFHHSKIIKPDPTWVYGYEVLRGTGIDGIHDGIVQGNLVASYSHLRAVGGNRWTERFLAHIQNFLT